MATQAACRVCAGDLSLRVSGTNGHTPTAKRFAPSLHEPGEHGDLLECVECGTVQQALLPTGAELHDLYRDVDDEAYLSEETGRRATAAHLLDLIGEHVGAGRLLDVGCGHGLLLDEARRRGFDVVGLELSRAAARHARETLGLDVREEPVERFVDLDGFDVVVLADVLEHLDDPVAAVDRCAGLLRPGGALCVVTPDPSSLTARIAGRRWWGYVPAHHCLLPRATLRELVSARDLVIAGGMPRWKWLGNRLLTGIENRVFGVRLSEYHTGYRAFSAELLRSIPFLRNSDDFVFDQQIFAQVLARGARIVEVPIPTRYFGEASSVDFVTSLRYGVLTLGVLARFALDRRRGRWPLLRRSADDLGG